jgi:beta-galactosidase
LVIAPALHIVPEAVAANLKHFVQSGGVLVLTPRSGVKDESNAVINRRLPGLLAELCGVEVEEYDSLSHDTSNALEFTLPGLASWGSLSANVWCDILRPNGATVVARYTRDYYAGKPAITLNNLGQPKGGRVVYVGTVGNVDLYQVLAGWLLDLADVQPLLTAPEGVEVTERWDGYRRLLFVLNHTDQEQQVALDGRYKNLFNGSEGLDGTTAIASRDVAVLLQDT